MKEHKNRFAEDYADHIAVLGPRFAHSMNGQKCRRRWWLLTFTESGHRQFFCPGCDVGIGESAPSMFKPIMKAMENQQ